MDKYQSRYRIPSARLQNWDYRSNGAYFITICTQNREHSFGSIVNAEMQLNELGELGEQYWMEIPNHFPFVELGNFIVMPDHMHGILIINNPDTPIVETLQSHNVERLIASLPITDKTGGFAGDKNPMFHQNISRIIRWYKGRCSFEMRKLHTDFAWQSRFYDHIIRDSLSFENIQNYIINNPANWEKDNCHA